MNVFIPTIGSELILAKACPVTIHSEYRNSSFLSAMGVAMDQKYINKTYGDLSVENKTLVAKYKVKVSLKEVSITIPAGTALKVTRIYIRQGAEDFDSMTFQCAGNKDFPKGRFWLKLTDVNRFNVEDPTPVADIQAERKASYEENQKKKNIALYNKVQRFVVKTEKAGNTLDGLVSDLIKRVINKCQMNGNMNVEFYSEMYANRYDNFKERLQFLEKGEGDSLDRKAVSNFLYTLEHPDTM